ncbi:ribonuclease HI [Synechococcus elongatus]|uniref:Ribonuclease H n=1 Tax=Synechococcus elongatus PCC 11802 TaxID=2283154 RepID=A0AAT9JTP2_SYNEL|nr:ribonuclease HI [Synechococcus elongatus]QFZ91925.1 ribonuclease HI [Synechococcus elongatus PCC 11802]
MSDAVLRLYTDGACTGNPGPGGWGVQIQFADGSIQELGGYAAATTNNRMELQAAIAALEFWRDQSPQQPVTLYTDSEYVIKGITQWLKGWQRKGWKTAQNKPVLNQDLWMHLDDLNAPLVQWQHVRGHNGDPSNERCDQIARSFAQQRPLPLCQRSDAPLQSGQPQQEPARMPEVVTPESGESPRDRSHRLRDVLDCLQIAEVIADKQFLITSSELADLMDVNASAVTSRGEEWIWRNWRVKRDRREGNQILWQLERIR